MYSNVPWPLGGAVGGPYDPALAAYLNAGSTHGVLHLGTPQLPGYAHPQPLQPGVGLPPAAAPLPTRAPRGAELYRLKICGVPACTDARLRQLFSLCGTVRPRGPSLCPSGRPRRLGRRCSRRHPPPTLPGAGACHASHAPRT